MVDINSYITEEERFTWKVKRIVDSLPLYSPISKSWYMTAVYYFEDGTALRDGVPVERVEIDYAIDDRLSDQETILDVRVTLEEYGSVCPLSEQELNHILIPGELYE